MQQLQLRKLADLSGYHPHARDGEIGKLKQIYFDDKHWIVRYFVVHTGSWLLGKDVLIVPAVVTAVDEENKQLEVDLSREKIRNSPPVDKEMPVSRHYEQEYYRYYNWEPYWTGDSLFGPAPTMPPPVEPEKITEPKEPEHPNLRSSEEVKGYHIHARDDEFGHVEDFILEDPGWAIRYLEVDTRKWLPEKHVLVSPIWIHNISWANHEITINLNREATQTALEYDASKIISHDYETALYKHYGMKFYEE